jgi:flagellar biosynthetic protein FliO
LCAFASSSLAAVSAVVDWNEDTVNVRTEPSTKNSRIIATLRNGVKVTVLREGGRDKDWSRIRSGATEGWVVSKSLKPTEEKPEKTAPAPEVAAPAASAASAAPSATPSAAVPPAAYPPASVTSAAPSSIPPGGYLSDIPEQPVKPELDVGGSIVRLFSGLLLVLAIIGGLVWVARRYFGGKIPGMKGAAAIRLLTTRPMGARQALLLVEVGGEVYLLAQSEGSIDLLSKIETPSAIDRLDYLFNFKASAFESELRRQVDVESREPGDEADSDPDLPPPQPGRKGLSVEERLAKLRRRFGPSGNP